MSEETTDKELLLELAGRVGILEDEAIDVEGSLQGLRDRMALGIIHQSNGKGVFHALCLTKDGKASREKALAALLTAGPLILIPILTSRGVDPVLVSGIAAWFSTQGVSSWRARHQRDKPNGENS